MNPRIHIVLAFGLLIVFAFVIWKPSITGGVSAVPERVVVVLKASSSNSITGSVVLDDAVVELKASTALAQQVVLEDVNAPSLVESLLHIAPSPDVVAERSLEIVPAMVVEATPEGIEELKAHPLVEAVYPNIDFDLLLAQSVPLINADDVWNLQVDGNPVDGRGASVCVIDTGISPHVAFQDRIAAQKCFCSPNCCPNGQAEDDIATDSHPISHGTHVSGIIAANGQYKGVAPGANIVAVKVCGLTCTLADIISGMDYCLQVKDDYNVVAISGSLGDGGKYMTQEQCPTYFDSAIDAAFGAGITSVFASGNNGYLDGISYPGCSPNAIGVGATDKSDNIASFSNRGELLDVLAPGVSITSTKAGNTYGVLSGTSQATPHVSGVVALLQQVAQAQDIVLSPSDIRDLLKSTGVFIVSWKRVDALSAVQSLLPEPPANTPPVVTITLPADGAVVGNPVSLQGTAVDAEDGELVGVWKEGAETLGTGNQLSVSLSASQHAVVFSAVDSEQAVGEDSVSFTVGVCQVDVDQNANAGLDIGDLVLLLTKFFNENLECLPGPFCVIDLDMNSNGNVDIGDFVLLLTAYSQETLCV